MPEDKQSLCDQIRYVCAICSLQAKIKKTRRWEGNDSSTQRTEAGYLSAQQGQPLVNFLSRVPESRLGSEGARESSVQKALVKAPESAARQQSRNKGQAKHIHNIQRRACTTWGERGNYYVGVVAWLTMSTFHCTETECSAYALR